MKALLTVFFIVITAGALTGRAATGSSIDPVAELQDAALNYEAAAEAQLAIAHSLLQARQDPAHDEPPEKTRRRRDRNASLHLQASDQFMGAAGQLDHATRAWDAAAKATSEAAASDYFSRASDDAQRRATALIQRAAELAEDAALEYASLQDLQRQIQANHKAGRIREKLAGRR